MLVHLLFAANTFTFIKWCPLFMVYDSMGSMDSRHSVAKIRFLRSLSNAVKVKRYRITNVTASFQNIVVGGCQCCSDNRYINLSVKKCIVLFCIRFFYTIAVFCDVNIVRVANNIEIGISRLTSTIQKWRLKSLPKF